MTWRGETKRKLADVWLASDDRRAISAAADRVDALLANNPELVGEEFYGDFLIAVPPLSVVYSISTEDRVVEILDVYHRTDSDR
jgi:hypothetical protein